MINWKAFGYLFLGIGSVILIWGLIFFLIVNAGLSIFEQVVSQVGGQTVGQTLFLTALGAAMPAFIGASICYVIGGVGLFLDSENQAEMDFDSEEDLFDRLDKLENVFDNNFTKITERLDKIEEKQNVVSRNTLIKVKKA